MLFKFKKVNQNQIKNKVRGQMRDLQGGIPCQITLNQKKLLERAWL